MMVYEKPVLEDFSDDVTAIGDENGETRYIPCEGDEICPTPTDAF